MTRTHTHVTAAAGLDAPGFHGHAQQEHDSCTPASLCSAGTLHALPVWCEMSMIVCVYMCVCHVSCASEEQFAKIIGQVEGGGGLYNCDSRK